MMSAMNDEWELRLVCKGVELLRRTITVADGSSVVGIQASVTFTQPDEAWPYDAARELVPFRDLEEIAAWVRGDGTDAQRSALADGILEGRRGALKLATPVSRMQAELAALPDEAARIDALKRLTVNRCPKCFDFDASGNFWCCYESRGD